MKYIHEIDCQKVLNEISVGWTTACEQLFQVRIHADVVVVEFYGHKQRNVLEETSVQGYHAETFWDGFQDF